MLESTGHLHAPVRMAFDEDGAPGADYQGVPFMVHMGRFQNRNKTQPNADLDRPAGEPAPAGLKL
jgi:hypothetical protein